MRSEPFEFENAKRLKLSGRLDRPDGTAHAYALFAHCFTCNKSSKAAVLISRALAAIGIGVVRFDFTGLGESEGDFGATGFSSNVQDLIAAAQSMTAGALAPTLLVGHSLGGAAVLAAAADIPSVRAVVTLGAPSEPSHVAHLLGEAGVKAIETGGRATVDIGGRPFEITQAFLDDIRMQTLKARIGHLGRALLVMHSPLDAVVGIDNASEIFLAARHPKSFVSLDTADHLLTRHEDADYAAQVIAAWASRYIDRRPPTPADDPGGDVHVEETGAGAFQVEVRVRGARFFADEPLDVGGLGSGPSPYELLAAGLGACTSMTTRLYAKQKGWPLERVRVVVRHEKVPGQTPPDSFHRAVDFEGPLDDAQRARLIEIADKCPVHRTLESGARVVSDAFGDASLASAAPPAAGADQHFCDMDATCREGD
ncbi:MAG TPA: bifunctional alpha/beta hydrolase/OsmC family protein [Caulobacteraceae bacterium]|nr:bifunctional alpha/beta hydrolase/OsmC family protein [Caulobacteraceae bacterium]